MKDSGDTIIDPLINEIDDKIKLIRININDLILKEINLGYFQAQLDFMKKNEDGIIQQMTGLNTNYLSHSYKSEPDKILSDIQHTYHASGNNLSLNQNFEILTNIFLITMEYVKTSVKNSEIACDNLSQIIVPKVHSLNCLFSTFDDNAPFSAHIFRLHNNSFELNKQKEMGDKFITTITVYTNNLADLCDKSIKIGKINFILKNLSIIVENSSTIDSILEFPVSNSQFYQIPSPQIDIKEISSLIKIYGSEMINLENELEKIKGNLFDTIFNFIEYSKDIDKELELKNQQKESSAEQPGENPAEHPDENSTILILGDDHNGNSFDQIEN